MGIRSHGNKFTNSVGTNPTYSSGQKAPGIAAGKSACNVKVGNGAGMKESLSRSGDSKGAPAFKQGGRA